MNGTIKFAAPLIALIAIAGCNAGGSSTVPGTPGQSVTSQGRVIVPDMVAKGLATPACPQVVGKPTCLALIDTFASKVHGARPDVAGWQPADFQTRYNLPSSTKGSGQIVAIVDAYDNPNVASDLAAYRIRVRPRNGQLHQIQPERADRATIRRARRLGRRDRSRHRNGLRRLSEVHDLSHRSEQRGSNDLDTAEAEAVTLGAHIVSNSWVWRLGRLRRSSTHPRRRVSRVGGRRRLRTSTARRRRSASVVSVGGTVLSKSGSSYSGTRLARRRLGLRERT